MTTAHYFLNGMVVALTAVAALFFFSFWHRSRDALFFLFGTAFVVLAVNVVALSFLPIHEGRAYLYLLRLFAFVLIIAGIVWKNLRRRRGD